MSSTYRYDKTNDFPSGIDTDKLENTINADNEVTSVATLLGITMTGDIIDMEFDTSLSALERNRLRYIIDNHLPTEIKPIKVVGTFTSTQTTTYETILALNVNGETVNPISSISFLGYMTNNMTSYTARIFDTTNTTTICDQTFTNTSIDKKTFSTLSNLPSDSAILEFQVKLNKTGNAKGTFYLHEVSIE